MITSPSCAWRGQFGYHFRCLKSAHTFSLVGAYPAHTWTPFCGHRPHIFASKPTIQLHSKPAKPGSPNQPQGASQPANQETASKPASKPGRGFICCIFIVFLWFLKVFSCFVKLYWCWALGRDGLGKRLSKLTKKCTHFELFVYWFLLVFIGRDSFWGHFRIIFLSRRVWLAHTTLLYFV